VHSADKRRSASAQSAPQAVQKLKSGRASNRNEAARSESRARVLRAVRSLFAEYGFEATSIRQIANELNIVSASLYHHFLTKEEMLHEIVRGPLLRLAKCAVTIAHQPTDAEHRLVELIVLRIQAWLDDWEAHAIASNESQFFRQRKDFSYVQDAKVQGYRAIESILQDGIDAGLFRPDLDIYRTITMLSGILTAAARSVRVGEDYAVKPPAPCTIDKVAEVYVDAIMRVIRTEQRIAEPIPHEALRMLTERPI
jgi:AcrR family transcriptional regulator